MSELHPDVRSGSPHAERRRQIINGFYDLTTGRGLEVGPLDAPIVARDEADVSYVDVASREELVAHYSATAASSVHADAIPEIDFWLKRADGTFKTLPDAVAPGGFDWVVASHVIEHVPDMITWLQEIGQVLVDGGALVLVVPDRRFCFDVRRSRATVGQILQAFDRRDQIPSVQAVYDHFRTAVHVDPVTEWQGRHPDSYERVHSFDQAVEHLERSRAGEYVDVHVWPMTPREFVEILDELGRLDLHELVIRELKPTERGSLEFFVLLERLPRTLDADEMARLRAAALAKVLGDLPDEELTVAHQLLKKRVRKLQRDLSRAEAAGRRAQHRLDDVQGSVPYRLGDLVSRPFRRLRRMRERA